MSFIKAFSVRVTSARVLFIIVIFETSPVFKYFSNVEIFIFFVPEKLLLFPRYEKIIKTEIINPYIQYVEFFC